MRSHVHNHEAVVDTFGQGGQYFGCRRNAVLLVALAGFAEGVGRVEQLSRSFYILAMRVRICVVETPSMAQDVTQTRPP